MKSKPYWTLAVMLLTGFGLAAVPVQKDGDGKLSKEEYGVMTSLAPGTRGATPRTQMEIDEFVRSAETTMDELKNGIEALKAASRNVGPNIQGALDEQIDVLQEQQQVANQTLDELKLASGEGQLYLQAHFINIWNEIVASYEAAELLLIIDGMGTAGYVSAWQEVRGKTLSL